MSASKDRNSVEKEHSDSLPLPDLFKLLGTPPAKVVSGPSKGAAASSPPDYIQHGLTGSIGVVPASQARPMSTGD